MLGIVFIKVRMKEDYANKVNNIVVVSNVFHSHVFPCMNLITHTKT